MKEVTFTIELANALLQYLGTRPYQEVVGLITEMQKQAQPKPEAPPEQQ